MFVLLLSILSVASCGPSTESYKDQFCTDPRTLRKHAAYSEWADAYSCTRHRCQPGGRNLAIYTVGCKRVEAPESAIECEEVVEDTNMQFPFCCTRLRCLVVVRGEVWTRVLGQPWEALPAAPWSHMYKMKKPPPADNSFLPKTPEQGPVYELAESKNEGSERDGAHEKVLRAAKADERDCGEEVPRAAAPPPDIVIALSTTPEKKESKKREGGRHKRVRSKNLPESNYYEEERDHHEPDGQETEDNLLSTEKPADPASDERYYAHANMYGVTQKTEHKQATWTEIPESQWNVHDPSLEADNKDTAFHQPSFPEHKAEKPSNLQALVDAIGSRMRDIESVVQKMSDKVHQEKPADVELDDKRLQSDDEISHKRHKGDAKDPMKPKRPNPDGEHYNRFSVRNRGSKYLRPSDSSTEQPLFVEDTNMNGYFSDASNSVLRRSNGPKEPAQTYMAPVETRRKSAHIVTANSEEKEEKKHKKTHKKKKNKHHKKKHGKDDKKRRFNRLSSVEVDKNVVSLEDSRSVGSS